ncbi:MAG: hypothetical protein HZT43_16550 [Exiguobacterium profundum]|nr:MAG: hypothetical protein HZT43_16550 [Exiguobacterium profundum]
MPDATPDLAAAIRALGTPAFPDRLTDWLQPALVPDNLLILAYRSTHPPQVLHRWSRTPRSSAHSTTTRGAWRLDPT